MERLADYHVEFVHGEIQLPTMISTARNKRNIFYDVPFTLEYPVHEYPRTMLFISTSVNIKPNMAVPEQLSGLVYRISPALAGFFIKKLSGIILQTNPNKFKILKNP